MCAAAAGSGTSFRPSGLGRASAIVFGALVALLVLVSMVWALGREQLAVSAPGVATVLLAVGAAMLAVALAAPLAGGTVRAIARHTFIACLRTKVAAVFVVLLAVALGTLPMIMRGDGTLSGRVQTFLAYGTGVVSVLLSLVTVLLSAGVIANDVRTKQVFSVAVKPVGRWQYVLGRWLGLVVLNAALLAVAGGALYGLARYLGEGEPLNPNDRRKLETEVFSARRKVRPVPIDVEARIEKRLADLKQDRRKYQDTLKAFLAEAKGDKAEALKKLWEQKRAEILDEIQSRDPPVPNRPARPLRWVFKGIDVAGKQIRGRGEVRLIAPKYRACRIRTDESLTSRLFQRGPVQVNGVEGMVIGASADFFDVRFGVEAMGNTRIAKLKPGDKVEIAVDPVIQIQYKASPAGDVPDDQLHSTWVVTNPTTGAAYYERRADPAETAATLTPPARVVDGRGRTVVLYFNRVNPQTGTGTKVTIREADIAVLYRVGRFGWNFLRGIGLIQLQLMFLAAVGVLAASFASFPVACLLCFSLLPFSVARSFLSESVKLPTATRAWEVTWYEATGHYVLKLMAVVLPDFDQTSPGDRLVDGMYISWSDLGGTALLTLSVRAVLALALACLIFHKRELARVQA